MTGGSEDGDEDPFDFPEAGEEAEPPPRPGLGAWGQLAAALLAVGALIAAVLAGAAVLSWMLG